MSDITKICDDLASFCSSANCSDGIEIGFPKKIVLGKPKVAITSAIAGLPTPAEVQTYIDAGNGIVFDVTNGAKPESEVTTKTGADTYSNTEEVTAETESISFTIRKITNSVELAIKQNNLNFTQMRLFWVDSNNRWHGGATGYLAPNYIKSYMHEGFESKAQKNVVFKWISDMYSYLEVTNANADYADIVCLDGTYSETVVTTYTAGFVTGYAGISGWIKSVFPTIYAKYVGTVISFYGSAANRTAGTDELATCDAAVSSAITEANSSGFGGSLSHISNSLIDGAEWNITFSN